LAQFSTSIPLKRMKSFTFAVTSVSSFTKGRLQRSAHRRTALAYPSPPAALARELPGPRRKLSLPRRKLRERRWKLRCAGSFASGAGSFAAAPEASRATLEAFPAAREASFPATRASRAEKITTFSPPSRRESRLMLGRPPKRPQFSQ
jgi:hypothetical protein